MLNLIANGKIEKVFLINLPESTDRKICMESRLNNITLKSDVEWFEAIKLNEKNEILANCFLNRRITNAELGCMLSHYTIIKEAAMNGLKNIWIMEDDIEFYPNFLNNLEKCLNQLPENFDFLYFGANHQSAIEPYSENLAICRKMFTTHSYVINYQIFDEILSKISAEMPIDVCYSEIHQRGKSYTSIPSLCWQVNGFSIIENTIVTNREQVTRIL